MPPRWQAAWWPARYARSIGSNGFTTSLAKSVSMLTRRSIKTLPRIAHAPSPGCIGWGVVIVHSLAGRRTLERSRARPTGTPAALASGGRQPIGALSRRPLFRPSADFTEGDIANSSRKCRACGKPAGLRRPLACPVCNYGVECYDRGDVADGSGLPQDPAVVAAQFGGCGRTRPAPQTPRRGCTPVLTVSVTGTVNLAGCAGT